MSGKSVPLRSVVAFLEKWAPLELAESWDNVGLLVEPASGPNTPVSGVLLTNDLTEAVLDEALSPHPPGVQLVLSYHPPIFKPLARITTQTWQGRILSQCLKHGIAIYSPHTSWDNSVGGISEFLLSPLSAEIDDRGISVLKNSGRQCTLKDGLPLRDIVERYKAYAGVKHVRLVLPSNASIVRSWCKSIAVCAGSGSSVLAETIGKCDLWITGEMSHHELLNAQQSGTIVLLLEHSNSERKFLHSFKENFCSQFPDLNVFVSKADADPVTIV